jgi:hypothetical protein
MIAICQKCGSPKTSHRQRCESCHGEPGNDDELALAFMLTDQFLSREKLAEASKRIKSGQRIALPPHIRAAVLAAIQGTRSPHAEAHARRVSIILWLAIPIGIPLFLFLIYNPWLHYQWSTHKDTVSSYSRFVNRFPESDYSELAKKRILALQEPEVWSQARTSGQIEALRKYVRRYPDGEHLDEAKTRITGLADAQWNTISMSRSESEIRKFIHGYPETTKTADAENRIQDLFNDIEWVREQDTIEHYQRFLSRHPHHSDRRWIEKRIIDLEVRDIAAGDYGEMPRANPLSIGGSTVKVQVENRTGYDLTVRYSGPESVKLVITSGATRSVSLPPGHYKIAASVDSSNVRNYYGTDTMNGGEYSSSFYIQRTY